MYSLVSSIWPHYSAVVTICGRSGYILHIGVDGYDYVTTLVYSSY
jgi:hypothetical protein